ncbi:MAG: histidinol-phosphatase [Firmicutes bacterium]|nr:histidinol-phosphatase [Bacillota bacterium]
MIKQNLHSHCIYCDGKNTLEEMVLSAIDKNFTILGLSSHAYSPHDDVGMSKEVQEIYKKEILELKEKYKDKIQIFLGLEQDITYRTEDPESFEYLIGSKHYMEKNGEYRGIDYSSEVTTSMVNDWYNGSFLEYAKDYYEGMKEIATWDEIDIVGHIDLLMKFNEDQSSIQFDDPQYLAYAYDAIDCLVEANKILEVNTGAIARGYRTLPYPHQTLLEYMAKKGARILLNSDCHDKDYLDCAYELSLDLIKKAGFTSMEVLTENGFVSTPIEKFIA